MVQLIKRPEAATDLEDIWWYIAQDSPEAADRLLDRIQEKLLSLSQFPQMGASRDELMPRLRSFSVSNYLIFYFPLEDGIDVIRVLHGARDTEVIFQSD
ncbi:type II toxin-antitoxin system RelE/ParE family toxin [Chamaesiphon sp. OTE_20_metabat_361]|uniref:type II toxin-antitoxin system RelE/ParE family toxin n=1 Tax=Chamaesiphon sp. OTE_20_metabat_361 TaxID=2964689 RepID=UPI00286CED59|nr:type II toxin-antitoxin system RelE/ParE family toxin [Chamaesiphon sp. OTE_20_metabat_361]